MTDPLILTHPPRPGESDRDVRYTPARAVEVLLDICAPPSEPVLDCCAGDGAILRVLAARGYDVEAVEIREEEEQELAALGPVKIGDWLQISSWYPQRSIVTNPPYSIGPAILAAALGTGPPYLAALLRLNHLGSSSWFRFWRQHGPSMLLVLGSWRPSFTGDGKTDASEYCWAIWMRDSRRRGEIVWV